jgi:hypothetical protein
MAIRPAGRRHADTIGVPPRNDIEESDEPVA